MILGIHFIDSLTCLFLLFFFNDTATSDIYSLSLHDALPIFRALLHVAAGAEGLLPRPGQDDRLRSEEHTSELQSPVHLVCRLLLEKKNQRSSLHFQNQYQKALVIFLIH